MVRVCALVALPDGESTRVLAAVGNDGESFAVDDTGAHRDASLSDGVA
jgi:hypothetical protein